MQVELKDLGRGFAEPARCSQAVFRQALDGLSHPGRLQTLDASTALQGMQAPRGAHPAAAALLLALLDQDCKLWLSPAWGQSDAAAWLRFHTGCVVVQDAAQADFAWIASAADVPALGVFAQGSAEYPDQGATCIVQVESLARSAPTPGWTLTGPGIKGSQPLHVGGLAQDFCAQWRSGQTHFPCGVDMFFTHGPAFVGLPRSTMIEG
jgi:alpha-D-ribose 1-methylphosphonate 5-triphosphate synthase subunit PhnH